MTPTPNQVGPPDSVRVTAVQTEQIVDSGRSRRRTFRGLVLGLGGLLALNLFVAGFVIASRENDRVPIPSVIESVYPLPDTLSRPIETIHADLDDLYTGVLIVDGIEIPEDQLQRQVPLGIVSFRPGKDREIERLDAGFHRVDVEYWSQEETREQSRIYTWTFTTG